MEVIKNSMAPHLIASSKIPEELALIKVGRYSFLTSVAHLLVCLTRAKQSQYRQVLGRIFSEMCRVKLLRFLVVDYKLQVIRVLNRWRKHMKCKQLARQVFDQEVQKAILELLPKEQDLIAINSCFELSPFLGYLNEAVKKELFDQVFNELLLAYLKSAIQEKLQLSRLV